VNVFIIAEKNKLLFDAISKVPESKFEVRYKYGYIELPETGDELLPAFTSTIVLQLLAFKMSILKQNLLNSHSSMENPLKSYSFLLTFEKLLE